MSRVLPILILVGCWTSLADAQAFELDPDVEARILEIRADNPDLQDDVFAKMGGSSVVSKAFLHCLPTDHVDLGAHPELGETIAYFDTQDRNSFNRKSQAAGVGWNLKYALGGRPVNFREEAEATQARWAFVLFGGNDAQNQNERIYARRLIFLIEELEAMGVVPILGSAAPRRNKTRDRWIQRFNSITEAVARHWDLPFVDYYAAMAPLPRKGLARDGVHPNVMKPGGIRAACQFTEKGLRYGNNARNLLTLQVLDALRRSVEPDEPDPVLTTGLDARGGVGFFTGTGTGTGTGTDTGAGTGTGTGTGTGAGADTDTGADTDYGAVSRPARFAFVTQTGSAALVDGVSGEPDPNAALVPQDLPFSALVDKPELAEVDLPRGCGAAKRGARFVRFAVSVDEPTRIRAVALDLDGYLTRVFWVRVGEEGSRCVKRRNQALEVAAAPGMWDLIVEVPPKAVADGQMLVMINHNPR